MTVLVAFASAHGSTLGIAARIADRLSHLGVPAEAHEVREPLDVSRFEAVVLGSAVHTQKWLPEAATFVRRHRAELASRPLWLFSVSSIGNQESFFGQRIGGWMSRHHPDLPEVQRYRTALRARGHRNFAGAVEPGHWGILGAAFLLALGGHHGDHRNWPAIDAWAEEIARDVRRA